MSAERIVVVTLGRVLVPLVSRSTYRGGLFLLLGGVVLLPYLLLATAFFQMLQDPATPVLPIGILAAVTMVIGTVPPFLPATRHVEIVATRALLGVDLPDPESDPSWPTRARAASWYVLHLISGGVVGFAVLYLVPVGVVVMARELGNDTSAWSTDNGLVFSGVEGLWSIPLALGLITTSVYIVAGLNTVMTAVAPGLLGPSEVERILALEAQAAKLAERNRLARELHDSVGHALTVTTLQAAAARRVLQSDPEFARRAMLAVEETGRSAMADLDHVLGLLRVDDSDDPASTLAPGAAPQRTLVDLDQLIEETRATGIDVVGDVVGDLDAVPAATSREAYRIVQECLTNALRHAGVVPVSLRVHATGDAVDVEVSNPLDGTTPEAATPHLGRGLIGMRERVTVLRGELTAGRDGEMWRVRAHLPGHDVTQRPGGRS